MMDIEAIIRKYEPRDRESIRRICCDTGFLGRPIDPIYQDRELFADLIVDPYLDREPEHAFVAEVDGQVVGYLISSTNTHFDRSASFQRAKTTTKMLWRAIFGKYNARSQRFAWSLLMTGLLGRPKHPRNAAQFHINHESAYRGQDLGRRLLTEFELMLREEGVYQYYGEVFSSANHRNEALFRRLGFEAGNKVKTDLFWPEVDGLYLMCVYKKLS